MGWVDAVNRVVGRFAMYLIFALLGILLYSAVCRYFFNMHRRWWCWRRRRPQACTLAAPV